jgi:hypothetical protein
LRDIGGDGAGMEANWIKGHPRQKCNLLPPARIQYNYPHPKNLKTIKSSKNTIIMEEKERSVGPSSPLSSV